MMACLADLMPLPPFLNVKENRMLALSRVLAVLVLLGCVVAPTMADSPSCACPLEAAMQKLPSLVFTVDGETTQCDKHAADLADQNEAPIRYVVQQLYDNKADAQKALISTTENLLASFATASTCKSSGTTTIAGQKIDCAKSAAKLAAAVETATKLVQVSYKVGDEQCNCPNKAKQLAEKSGEKVTFVVNNEETCCPTSNKLNLARAKYRAALQTVSTKIDGATSGKSDAKCQGCPVEAGMNGLPRLAFAVGGETTSCDKHAATLAKNSESAIQFAVQQSFDSKEQAMLAMVTSTESLVEQFATLTTCKKSGTTTIAGRKLHCSTTASRIAGDVKDAMDAVKVSFVVGDKTCHCPNEAQTLAKASGSKPLFVVGGEKTSCELTNRLNVARAKYRAAVQALAKQVSTEDGTAAKSQS